MKKQLTKQIMTMALLSVAVTGAMASPSQMPQQQDKGVYLGFMWMPGIYGYGVNSDGKLGGGGAFNPFGIQASLGYQFNQYVALDTTLYTMFFMTAPALDAKFTLPLNPSFSLYAKVGVAGIFLSSFAGEDSPNDGVHPYTGIGMAVRMTPHMDLNVETSQYYALSSDDYSSDMMGVAGLGITYHF